LNLTGSTTISVAQLRIPAKAKREYQRACSALIKKNSSTAEQHLRRAIHEYPKYSAAWVTLGQVLADERRSEDAINACSQAATMDRIYVPAYLCLAEIASRTKQWIDELRLSSRALELDPISILAYEYRAAANANLGNLGEAEKDGLRAKGLDNNHQEPGVCFLLAQIYGLRGDTEHEREQLREYLKYSVDPKHRAPAKQILAKLENGQHEGIEISESKTSRDMDEQSALRWGPASIDEVVPPIQENSTCPVAQILHEVGQRATELVENLQRITAIEQIEHTEFGKDGKPRMSSSERFDYTAEIEPSPSGIFGVNEYRRARGQTYPPPIEDTGTMALALIFHPKTIENFHVRCEGQTDLHGILAWQLWFEEGADPTRQFAAFETNDSKYWMRFKGRAWISMDNYQVLRLQTDLAAPIPEINLQLKHSDVAYAPVEFANHKFRVWLPESASNRICYRSRCYLRAHSFSHFQFFLVETEQKVQEPVPRAQNSGLNDQ
jgi:tetratricopeptide (TPR) repeat protein